MENVSGVKDTQMKIYKSSKKQFEVRLHGELNIFWKMREQNDRLFIQNGFIGMINFQKKDHQLYQEIPEDYMKHLKTQNLHIHIFLQLELI